MMREHLSLTELWSRTTGVHIEPPLIVLRVSAKSQPVGFLPNQNWLAGYERLDSETWGVALWGRQIAKPKPQDRLICSVIMHELNQIGENPVNENGWIPWPMKKDDTPAPGPSSDL